MYIVNLLRETVARESRLDTQWGPTKILKRKIPGLVTGGGEGVPEVERATVRLQGPLIVVVTF